MPTRHIHTFASSQEIFLEHDMFMTHSQALIFQSSISSLYNQYLNALYHTYPHRAVYVHLSSRFATQICLMDFSFSVSFSNLLFFCIISSLIWSSNLQSSVCAFYFFSSLISYPSFSRPPSKHLRTPHLFGSFRFFSILEFEPSFSLLQFWYSSYLTIQSAVHFDNDNHVFMFTIYF